MTINSGNTVVVFTGLEQAMRVRLWGHALFLASKIDQRTSAGVMTRFANGLAIKDVSAHECKVQRKYLK